MNESVVMEVDSGIGIVTLNRPQQHNAVDDVLIGELTVALQGMEADPDVRLVVLSSTGETFSAGADFGWLRRTAQYSEQEHMREARNAAKLLATLDGCSKPTLARVQGPAMGLGLGLVAACDIAIATFDAQFALNEVRMGLTPAVVAPYLIAAIGARRSRRFMLTGERFSASEAYRIGLVHEIVPSDEELDNAIGEVIDDLLASAPHSQAECKRLVLAVAHRGIDDFLIEDTARSHARIRVSPEGREGSSAVLENRPPHWLPPE